jgi:ankyrin repeat protein
MAGSKKQAKIKAKERGAALVERVIDAIKAGQTDIGRAHPEPLDKGALARLHFSNKKPLPPSLERWLAYDRVLPKPIGNDLVEAGSVKLASLSREVAAQINDDFQHVFAELEGTLRGDALGLDTLTDEHRVLWVGVPDSAGEYPVFHLDVSEDRPRVTLDLPGFDVWLAVHAGLIGADLARSTYKSAMAEHAKKNLEGNEEYEYEGGTWTEARHATRARPPAPAKAAEKAAKAKPAKADKGDAEAICDAAVRGNVDRLRRLLDDGISPSLRHLGDSPLKYAALGVQPETAELLLSRGADVNEQDDEENTPLHKACSSDAIRPPEAFVQLVKVLLAHGADPNAPGEFEFTPLNNAAHMRRAEIIKLLLDAGAAVQGGGGSTALHAALQPMHKPPASSLASVKLLVEHGADVNAIDADGDTPLMMAREQRKAKARDAEAILALLVAHGAKG